MFIEVNGDWISKSSALVAEIESCCDQFEQLLDSIIPPAIPDREGVLGSKYPALLFYLRCYDELLLCTGTARTALDDLSNMGTVSAVEMFRLMDELALKQRKLVEMITYLLALHPFLSDGNYFLHFNNYVEMAHWNRQQDDLGFFF